ncbi:unnamed protein product [Gongylonema pulchrum]|uniref:Protein kinase domain-containing protein n=1 Tax=Gongylonema pulchrum TaxID=637853 RepID=A0A183F0E8_9BILA|nr:unnamed protein product [Gongylonema pulchrum]
MSFAKDCLLINYKNSFADRVQLHAYGKVFLARKVGGRDHGTLYAIKVLRKSRVITKAKTLEHTLSERHVLERLKGLPFLVKMVYAFQSDSKLHIVMGWCFPCHFFNEPVRYRHFCLLQTF